MLPSTVRDVLQLYGSNISIRFHLEDPMKSSGNETVHFSCLKKSSMLLFVIALLAG